MSTPHLAGAVALLWSAAPALIGDIEGTRELLDQTRGRPGRPHLRRHRRRQQRVRRGPARRPGRRRQRADRRHRHGRGHGHRRRSPATRSPAPRSTFAGERPTRETTTDADGTYRLTLVDRLVRRHGRRRSGTRTRPATIEVEDGEDDHVRLRARAGRVVQADRPGPRPGHRRTPCAGVTVVDRGHAAVDRRRTTTAATAFKDVPAGTYDDHRARQRLLPRRGPRRP